MQSSPFTLDEQKIFNLIIEAHNKYVELEVTHPSDRQDWNNALHVLQRLMGQRILRREHPDVFISHITKEQEPLPPLKTVPLDPDIPFEPRRGLMPRYFGGNLGLD